MTSTNTARLHKVPDLPHSQRARQVYEVPDLPCCQRALEPYISQATLAYHHDWHHRGYVKTLNKLIVASPLNGTPLENIVRNAEGPLFNSAAQAWNHSFYWNCLSPDRGQTPKGALATAIDRDFGSLDAFLEKFQASALAKFGSGWTWLVADSLGTLSIKNSNDADTPLRWGSTPLLTCDVWEHAYYLDYRSDRKRYLDAFLDVTNWAFAEDNFDAASRSFSRTAVDKRVRGDQSGRAEEETIATAPFTSAPPSLISGNIPTTAKPLALRFETIRTDGARRWPAARPEELSEFEKLVFPSWLDNDPATGGPNYMAYVMFILVLALLPLFMILAFAAL